jgi:hypothetical protein
MAIKSAYREKPAEKLLFDTRVAEADPSKAELLPEEPIQPSESVRINFDTEAEPVVAIEPADEAGEMLKRQLQHLRDSERAQHEHAMRVQAAQMAQQAQRPMSREEKLEAWRTNGGDEGDIAFLESNPEMIDRHDLTVAASEDAVRQGHQRGTDAHRQATREIFHRHLGHQQAQPAASAQPAPAFFAPPPQPQARAEPSALYSAPVSRQAPSAGYREPSPRSVRLSPIEQEIARNLGLSDVAYAEGKIRLQRAKANGEMQ